MRQQSVHEYIFLVSANDVTEHFAFPGNIDFADDDQGFDVFIYGKPNVAIFNSFNFISSFVFCIQLCVQYSTCIQHSTRYSIFNFPFNIQLFILYSILHSPIQLPIQQFQLFIQHSTIHSTFNYSFQFN